MIAWLGMRTPFPPIAAALAEPNGLLAAGGDLVAGSPAGRLSPAASFPGTPRGSRSCGGAPTRAWCCSSTSFACRGRSRKRVRAGDVRGARRQCVSRRHRGVRGGAAATGSAAHGSRPRSSARTASCIGVATRIRSKAGATAVLVGGLYGLALGPGVLRRVDVRPRVGRVQGRARPSRRRSCGASACRSIDCQQETAHLAGARRAADPAGTVCGASCRIDTLGRSPDGLARIDDAGGIPGIDRTP